MPRTQTLQKSALLVIFSFSLAAHPALAICSGFTFGIGNLRSIGNGVNSCTLP